ncbi:putative transcriptional regulator containing an HTH domain and an uncharacterized domain shared with the mammalian protein Schlafen [Thermoplasmatales archaeon BRNA1]|nr:putative transcriptional regulator containing an HTH domain and an uncharacterized domain shared with the mammalian protein Schlafen [Thermoplasmatales archaeon BRNA1]
MVIVAVCFLAAGLYTEEWENILIAVPTLAIAIYLLISRRGKVYIPVALVAVMTCMMVALQTAKLLEHYGANIYIAGDILLGFFMCLVGLIVVFRMIRGTPGLDHESPASVTLTAFCVAETFSMWICVFSFGLDRAFGTEEVSAVNDFVVRMVWISVGVLLVAAAFYLNRHNGLFAHTLDRFLKENVPADMNDRQRKAITEMIARGESSVLEFKSTLRTNLKTGEKDPRIERAVLKTIVAFLNTKGGTLLIGVSDDGTINGIDEEAFDGSRDKLTLHLNHLVENQIGKEYIPYIGYFIVDFDGKGVMRVDCRRSDEPVFLTEKDTYTFFVRSGPSSIDLHGMDLLYYANRNFGKQLKRPQAGEKR